ncbi:MAG TPA: adenine deaminase [Chitinophagaceae bacterium]|nr:adenine deaminase [Chitinophagaceae bacterium]
MASFSITGQVVDPIGQRMYPAEVRVEDGRIGALQELTGERAQTVKNGPYLVPGFVDSHVHIESSMLIPVQFARLAVVHGTVATVSDPHEIANVCGVPGVQFMMDNARQSPFKFNFGAPSCVPATSLETAGAVLDADAVEELLKQPEIRYLSEMMNFPGVLQEDPVVLQKIAAARRLNKPVDGHAPGLRGEAARRYVEAGISTDHECFAREEALEKIGYGMKILIREGSAAKNFDALIDLLNDYPDQMMFCSDDKHPDSLVDGHINQLCARARRAGIPVFHILRAACVNPVMHYKLEVGLLRVGDPADLVVLKDLETFEVLQTYLDGNLVAENGLSRIEVPAPSPQPINHFGCGKKQVSDFEIRERPDAPGQEMAVIEALDGQLITRKSWEKPCIRRGCLVSDPGRDLLKIAVVNRYRDAPVAVSFIRNFGLKSGAIASSVAHDSHNLVVVGVEDRDICRAVNLLISHQGGICYVHPDLESVLPLPVAGLMSQQDGYQVADAYAQLDRLVKDHGCSLTAPFMTLSFMALLVIPHLKLSDLGLFDGDRFELIPAVRS